tara:strand:- start:8527 stop:9081 length:555 start_codon:yes stop_codon:yes gene_type:complete
MANEKTLLNEETVRRFMKLAEISPLTNGFLETNAAPEEEINEMGGEMHAYKEDEDMPLDDAEAVDIDLETDVEDELAVDTDLGEPADAGMDVEAKLRDFFDAVAQAATDILGVDTSVETDAEPEEIEPMSEPEGEDVEVELDTDLGAPEGEEGLEESPEEDHVGHESMVQEITSRVARRLLKKN